MSRVHRVFGVAIVLGACLATGAVTAPAAAAATGRAAATGQAAAGQAAASGPKVTGVSPRYGPQSGGTFSNVVTSTVNPKGTVKITGTGLTGATAVLFDMHSGTVSVPVTAGQVNPAGTRITGVIPPPDPAAEGVSVQVVTSAGTSTSSCGFMQAGCTHGFFYLSVSSTSGNSLDLSSLNNKQFHVTPTAGPDGAKGGIVNECGYSTAPSPGPSGTAIVQFGPTTGATLTGNATLDTATNNGFPSAFLGNLAVTLNQPVKITVTLTAAYGDCIDVKTPLNFFGIAGLYIVLEPSLSGNVSYTLTLAAGTYTIGESGWVNGALQLPVISLTCPGVSACMKGSSPSWNIQAGLIAGPMIRLGPTLGAADAYVEAGPAVGLAAGTGSGGTFAEACDGGIWDGHLDVPSLGVTVGAGGPLAGPYQLAGTGSGPADQCPLGAAVGKVGSYTGTGIDHPQGITAGPDGALWFTNSVNSSIGRITIAGAVSNFTGTGIDDPAGIAAGSDGALWFGNALGNSVGRITTGGAVGNFTSPSIAAPFGITAGPDGALWFPNWASDSIGRISTSGAVTNYTGTGISSPFWITAGPDGALWFTNSGNNSIGRVTTSGAVSNYTGTGIDNPQGITAGPDGALWFANAGNNSIGRISTSGAVSNYTGTGIDGPYDIATGPDRALWFTNAANNSIGRLPVPAQPPSGGSWQNAQGVTGNAGFNAGGNGQVLSVSCASAGNCGAGGYYTDASGGIQPFAVSEVNGTWQSAQEITGNAGFNAGGNGQVLSVSCASAGNCSAGGYYLDSNQSGQAFVVNEVNGVWGKAAEVPGTAALNQGIQAQVNSVSCASAGNCSAGGFYTDGTGAANTWAFVVTEINGTWQQAQTAPGLTSLMSGGASQVLSVSCASAGNCSAGGFYTDGSAVDRQAFTIDQVGGTWGNARELPNIGNINTYLAQVSSVSCPSAGNCSAGGSYWDNSGNQQVFVDSETNGTWGNAEEAPGFSALNASGNGNLTSVSCASPGNCSAGGSYGDAGFHEQAFLVNQVNGAWSNAFEAPGTGALNQTWQAQVNAVSCTSPGSCSAGGQYGDGSNNPHAFVTDEGGNTWINAMNVPGLDNLQAGSSVISSMSCTSPSTCAAGGSYTDATTATQPLVVTKQ